MSAGRFAQSRWRLGSCKAGQREDGDVVVLAKVDSGLGSLFGVGTGREESLQAFVAVEFAVLIAGFEYAVGVEGEPVALTELESGFFVAG